MPSVSSDRRATAPGAAGRAEPGRGGPGRAPAPPAARPPLGPLSRRRFLGGAGAALAGLGLAPLLGAAAAPALAPAATVLRVEDPSALALRGDALVARLRAMVEQGLRRLWGTASAAAGLRQRLGVTSTVGLKVNCLAGLGLSTRPELVLALVQLLVEAGQPESRILVWDRSDRELGRAGFALRRSGPGYLCYGTERDYEAIPRESGSVGGCFSRLLTERCDLLIDLPVLKDHDLSGISGALKNFYGVIHNPNKYHDQGCDPYLVDLFAHPELHGKLRLSICDALRPQFDGGPAYRAQATWRQGALLLADDPVALDWCGWHLIEEARKEHGLRSLEGVGRAPRWIARAAERGLGAAGVERVREVRG